MGSGSNRKNSDNILIKRPKFNIATYLGLPSGADAAADVCKPSFEIKITPSSFTQENVPVTLQKANDRYVITVGGVEIGIINKGISEMISKCSTWGIKYHGKIILTNKKPYARFTRISK